MIYTNFNQFVNEKVKSSKVEHFEQGSLVKVDPEGIPEDKKDLIKYWTKDGYVQGAVLTYHKDKKHLKIKLQGSDPVDDTFYLRPKYVENYTNNGEIKALMRRTKSKKSQKEAVEKLKELYNKTKKVSGSDRLKVTTDFELGKNGKIYMYATMSSKKAEGFPPEQRDFMRGMAIHPNDGDFKVIGPIVDRKIDQTWKKALEPDEDTRSEAMGEREWDHTLKFILKPGFR